MCKIPFGAEETKNVKVKLGIYGAWDCYCLFTPALLCAPLYVWKYNFSIKKMISPQLSSSCASSHTNSILTFPVHRRLSCLILTSTVSKRHKHSAAAPALHSLFCYCLCSMATLSSNTHPPHVSIYLLFLSLLLTSYVTAKPFKYLNYSQIRLRLSQLAADHPTLIRVYSAQDRFSLPHVGNCSEQSYETSPPQSTPCSIWVVELSNFSTLPDNPTRPELLISGELHGDEVVGPHVTLAFLEYMASKYSSDPFVRRMVDTRHTTVIPMTNAVGFFKGERVERQEGTPPLSLDPNRDFGFSQRPEKCMQTVTARALNELFRSHLFRVLVTFHGGTNAIGYEWGDLSHCNSSVCSPAPDTHIMKALGDRMSRNAGSAGEFEISYPVGDMGKLVYPVDGGLEDWAYGASWEKAAISCSPSTLNGYPRERTSIDHSTKRCVTFLVETSRDKKPIEHHLGSDDDILSRGSSSDGHVPRNVRLLMSVIDSVEPYVVLTDEVSIDDNSHPVVSWFVSGAFLVDGTMLQWSTINGTHYGMGNVMNGTAGAIVAGGKPTRFSSTLSDGFPNSSVPLYFRIAYSVDSGLAKKPETGAPDVSPQSHLMGSRASTGWNYSVGDKKLQGRKVFFSETVKLGLSSSGDIQKTTVPEATWGMLGEGNLFSEPDESLYEALIWRSKESGHSVNDEIVAAFGPSSLSARATVLTGIGGIMGILAVAFAIYLLIRRRRSRRDRISNGTVLHFTLGEEDEEERRCLAPENSNQVSVYEGEEVLSVSGVQRNEGLVH